MNMIINLALATACTFIVISPFLYYKLIHKNRKKGIVVYNSPPTNVVGDKTGVFVKVK